jgi:hypothetical protein
VVEVPAVDDQYPVEQFAADGADPAFGDCVCLRGSHRGAQDADAFAGEYGIEDIGEFAVAVADQEKAPG